MKYSLKWIKKIVSFEDDPLSLFHKLSMSGSDVEGYSRTMAEIKDVVIAKILKIEKHPNADKLSLCDVTDGKDNYKVVCGAKNINENDTVPFAKINATLPGGILIKRTKIRNVESEGMICSPKELGISDDAEGILILNESYALGTDIKKYFDDIIFEIEVTPNRPDMLSHLGLAREISALYKKKFHFPELDDNIKFSNDSPVKVEVEDPDDCPRYSLIYIKNIDNGKSPEDIKYFIEALGLNSKDLIVDISNYNMFEMGHPTHFFDADNISGRIIIRRAKKGEKCTTIDKIERVLNKDHLVIADEEKILAIAGIMGCLGSEINMNTKNIAIESAVFNPSLIRRTRVELGINSDASYRFERGIDIELPIVSLKRILYLLKKYTKFEFVSGIIDAYRKNDVKNEILLKKEKIDKILSCSMEMDRITEIMTYLGFKMEKLENNTIKVNVPSFRSNDIKNAIDVIEEIGRIYGYDNIQSKRPCIIGELQINKYHAFKDHLRTYFSARGFYEVMNISIKDEATFTNYGYNGIFRKIVNPLSSDHNILRPLIFPALVDDLVRNLKYKKDQLKFFEIANSFGEKEEEKLSVLIYGKKRVSNWLTQKDDRYVNFFDLKGEIEALFDYFNATDILFEKEEFPYFLNGNSAGIHINGERIGFAGVLKKEILPSKRIMMPVLVAEISLKRISRENANKYTEFSQFPMAERDISMVFSPDHQVSHIVKEIKNNASVNLKDIYLYDEYKISEKEISLTFRLVFQSEKKTLNDKEVDYFINKVISTLEEKFNGKLR